MAGIQIIDIKEVDDKMVKTMLKFNLSEKMMGEMTFVFAKKDVKEFIRRDEKLIEEIINAYLCNWVCEKYPHMLKLKKNMIFEIKKKRDELAGEKLIK